MDLDFQQVPEVQGVLENLNSPMVRGYRRDQTNQVSLMDLESRRVLVDLGFQMAPTDLQRKIIYEYYIWVVYSGPVSFGLVWSGLVT